MDNQPSDTILFVYRILDLTDKKWLDREERCLGRIEVALDKLQVLSQ